MAESRPRARICGNAKALNKTLGKIIIGVSAAIIKTHSIDLSCSPFYFKKIFSRQKIDILPCLPFPTLSTIDWPSIYMESNN
jgi:hypothetical protein